MKKCLRKFLEIFFSVLGVVLGLYVGGYLMFIRSVGYLYNGFLNGGITKSGLVFAIVCIFLSTTVIGFFWCVCDIIAGIFRDNLKFKDL